TGPGADTELAPEVEGVSRAPARRKIPAVAAAIDTELDELVTDAEHERAGQIGRVRCEELEIARRDARDRIAVLVGAIEIAVVHKSIVPSFPQKLFASSISMMGISSSTA